ncbi:MAG: response regulator transcription factor, partial [Nannocystaceae bacterium]
LMLPERSGFELLECWRERTRVPVLVLTARKDLAARVQSFKLGAVDWMSKPFFMEELLARINTRLHPKPNDPTTVLGWGDVQLDLGRRLATVAGRRIELTGHEFNLLAMLVQRPGRVMSRRQLGSGALPANGDRCDRTINSHIARIRRKLGPAGNAIRTVRGAGYCFESSESID